MRKHVPIRTCIVTRAKKPKEELIRLVKSDEGSVLIDMKGKMKGRGANMVMRVEVFDKAIKKRLIEKALRLNKLLTEGEVSKLREEFVAAVEEKNFREHNKPVKIRVKKEELLNKVKGD